MASAAYPIVVAVIGETVLAKLVDLRTEGLMDGDEITASLLAAVFAEALRRDQTPRAVLDSVWEALPSCDVWNESLESDVRDACDLYEAGI